jgi:hypothetical protein
MLSNKTVSKIADAVKKDVIEHIYMNEKYAEAMQELVTEALDATLGEMDEDLYFDIAMLIFDRIELK